MLKLVGTDGNKYYSFDLKPGNYKVGRSKDADICIMHKTVSGNHARLSVEDSGRILINDVGSRNGTVVNGRKISEPTKLSDGDSIMFGLTEFRVRDSELPDKGEVSSQRISFTGDVPENSIFVPIDEAMRPLPRKLSEMPELMPTIFDMAKLLGSDEPRGILLDKALKLICRLIPADRVIVIMVSEDQQDIDIAACHTSSVKGDDEITLSRTIIVDIIENKNSLLIKNPLTDPKFSTQNSIISADIKSVMAVPLFDEGRVLGILYADTSNPAHEYNDDYLRIMATFGNLLGSRLLNYELSIEREAKQVLSAELRQASKIQRNLLPSEPLEIDGYKLYAYQEQSRQVGGDLYDYKILPDGSLVFVLGDVTGKGMGAALLMSNILAAFRVLYEKESFTPATAVKTISTQLLSYSKSNSFVTLFVGLLDPDSGIMRYVNAGHNPPLLLKQDGALEHMEPTGMMAGAFEFAEWEEKTVELAKGDSIFIFSDGLSEADRSGSGDQFGDERTEKAALESKDKDPRGLIEDMAEQLKQFMGDAPQSDDIT
ncbi:MAG TPA: FHA domain-containing protein, partial [candidate division Zixibacteria bacterium]|nr:FHA domain-containing protein [candidate division Zixibacteria bacterium]